MTTDSPTITETEPIQRTLEEILPPYTVILHNDDLEAVKNNEAAWRLLEVMAEQVLDLKNQTVR